MNEIAVRTWAARMKPQSNFRFQAPGLSVGIIQFFITFSLRYFIVQALNTISKMSDAAISEQKPRVKGGWPENNAGLERIVDRPLLPRIRYPRPNLHRCHQLP